MEQGDMAQANPQIAGRDARLLGLVSLGRPSAPERRNGTKV
jgi:hypothetical protein